MYLLQKAAELQDRDARKSNAELFTELIDAAKLNGKEVLEDSMKMLSTSAGNFKKLFAKQMRRTSTQFDGLRTNYYRDKGKPSSQLTSDEV